METFTAQAFGEGELRLCGIYLNRCRVILTICAGFSAIIISQSKLILTSLGQEKLVVDYAASFMCMTFPAFYLDGLAEANRRWLNCLRLTYVPMIV